MATAQRQVRLYYFPSSFFSQKVLITLQEKEVEYEPVIVSIHAGEQNEAWYMRITSAGVVPVLQDGEKIIKESENIVDYIDREFLTDSKLVPDLSTEIGKEVSKWRKILDSVPVELVSFGILYYRDLAAPGHKLPWALRYMVMGSAELEAAQQRTIQKLQQLADEHPDLREAYTAKISQMQKRIASLNNKETIVKVLDDLEATMDQVEDQLKKVDADPSKELWFCGQQFTAADINLCILLGRLDLLGLSERYHNAETRPRLHAYWAQAKKRPTVRHVTVNMGLEMAKMKLKKSVKTVLPVVGGLVTLGLAAGLAYAFAQKR